MNSNFLVGDALHLLSKLFLAALFVCTIAVGYSYAWMLWLRRKLPPGPFPLPIVGNMLQLPKTKPWIAFEKWSQANGEGLLTVWVGRTPNIICNDAWSASELLEKRASNFSSRPDRVVMGDVTGLTGTNQVLLKYNDHWRTQRKLMHLAVGSQAVRQYQGFQADEASLLLADLMTSPEDYAVCIERYSCSIVSIVGWGRRISRKDDYIVGLALQMMETITQMEVPGAYWMEAIPELQFLPPWIYPLPTTLRKMGKALFGYWHALTQEGAMAAEPNFSKSLIASQAEEKLTKSDIGQMTANLIGGGVDTSTSTLLTCILGIITHPEVQKIAQAEIDQVVGMDRTPGWDDLEKLPYCMALFKETLRWRSVTVLGGLPHSPVTDDHYRGFYFPKGITIVGNLWAIHRNPKDFLEPDAFKPERYLDGKLVYPNARGHNAFGWGRRACSGQPLAEQGISMLIIKLLWAFNVKAGLDEKGEPIKLDTFAYTNAENMRPQPFKARFEPRNEKVKGLIVQESAVALERLQKWAGETKVTVEQFMGMP